jgi:parallel beta-helix repeat protein
MRVRVPAVGGALLFAIAAGVPAGAGETTFCNQFITSLPYTITVQGHYCFNRNLSTGITTGNAITINADYVVLDLNNFKLGGGAAGPGSAAFGVSSDGRSNVTVRNGNIRGFRWGIALEGAGASNLLVENNVVDGNLTAGIVVRAVSGGVVRDNIVTNTGGSTIGGWPGGFDHRAGITLISTTSSQGVALDVRNNVVDTVFGDGLHTALGIYANAQYATATDNVVRNVSGGNAANYGINTGVCRDNIVLNIAGGTGIALACEEPTGPNFPNSTITAAPARP